MVRADAPRKTPFEQIESGDLAELVAKTDSDIADARAAIARIEARIKMFEGRKKYLASVREMRESRLEGEQEDGQ